MDTREQLDRITEYLSEETYAETGSLIKFIEGLYSEAFDAAIFKKPSRDLAHPILMVMSEIARYTRGIAQDRARLNKIALQLRELALELQDSQQVLIDEHRIKKIVEFDTKREQEKAARKASKTRAGYVYIIKQVNGANYKIGHTLNPEKRKHIFDVKLPFPIEIDVLIKTDDRYALEKELHSKFEPKRVSGEWFELSIDDLEYLRGMAS